MFVYFSLRTANCLGNTSLEKVSIFLFYTGFCTLQHFCGYIEDYALTVMLLSLYLFASIQCIKGKMNWIVPALCLAFALYCHLIALMFAPPILYVLYEAKLKKNAIFRHPAFWMLLLIVGTLCFYPFLRTRVIPSLYPLTSKNDGVMSMFSVTHIWEFINGQILACGPGLFVAIGGVAIAIRRRAQLPPELLFLIGTSMSVLAGLFSFNEILGNADWDVCSYASLAVNLTGICLFFHLFRDRNWHSFIQYSVVTLVGLMFLHTVPWIALNRGNRSILRFEKDLMSDPGAYYVTHPQSLHIGIVLQANGLNAEALNFFKAAYTKDPTNPRNGLNYFKVLCAEKQVLLALGLLGNLQANAPGYFIFQIGQIYSNALSTNDTSLSIAVLDNFYTIYRNDSTSSLKVVSKDIIGYYLREYVNLLIGKHDINRAEMICKTAMDLDPQEGANSYYLARVLLEKGECDTVISMCVALAKRFPNMEFLSTLGIEAFRRKQNGCRSENGAFQSVEITPSHFSNTPGSAGNNSALPKRDSAGAYLETGIGLEQSGKLNEAIECFDKALTLNPDNVDARAHKGEAYAELGKLDFAVAQCQEALKLNPRCSEALNTLGVVFGEKGQPDEALKHLNEALRIDPRSENAHLNIGNVFIVLRKPDEAIFHCREALRLNPRFAEAHLDMGVAFTQKGEMDSAINHFKQALNINPGLSDAKANLERAMVLQQERK